MVSNRKKYRKRLNVDAALFTYLTTLPRQDRIAPFSLKRYSPRRWLRDRTFHRPSAFPDYPGTHRTHIVWICTYTIRTAVDATSYSQHRSIGCCFHRISQRTFWFKKTNQIKFIEQYVIVIVRCPKCNMANIFRVPLFWTFHFTSLWASEITVELIKQGEKYSI